MDYTTIGMLIVLIIAVMIILWTVFRRKKATPVPSLYLSLRRHRGKKPRLVKIKRAKEGSLVVSWKNKCGENCFTSYTPETIQRLQF